MTTVQEVSDFKKPDEAESRDLAARLVNALNESGVRYCHWKSNFDLSSALAGDVDLDLLIERKSLSRVLHLLLSFGFKSATAKWGPRTPSTYHYYGLDLQCTCSVASSRVRVS